MFRIDLSGDRFEMTVLDCRSLVLVSIITIRRWRNLSFSQRSKNFENVCIMLQKIIEQSKDTLAGFL